MKKRIVLMIVLSLSFCSFAKVRTDSLLAIGTMIHVKDSTRFLGGIKGVRLTMDSLYSIAARFLRIYSSQADIDSLVGDVKTGGSLSVAGNVGIGTITPIAKLSIIDMAITTTDALLVETGAQTTGHTACLYSNSSQSGNTLRVYQDGAGATGPALYVYSDGAYGAVFAKGNVGIKTITPTKSLDVVGSSTVSDTSFAARFVGPLTGNAATATTATNLSGGTVSGTSGDFTGNVNIDGGLQFDDGDLLMVYDTGSFSCTLKTSDVTVQQIKTARYERIGNKLYILLPEILGTSNSATCVLYCGFQFNVEGFAGAYGTLGTIPVMDNGEIYSAWYSIYTAGHTIELHRTIAGGFTSSGSKGILLGTTIFYTIFD